MYTITTDVPFRGKLTRLKNGAALRTDCVAGIFYQRPIPGLSFLMYAAPLTLPESDGYVRRVVTSQVMSLLSSDAHQVIFATQNSTYKLEIE